MKKISVVFADADSSITKTADLPISDEEYVIMRSEILTEGEHETGTDNHETLIIVDHNAPFDITMENFDKVNDVYKAVEYLSTDNKIIYQFLLDMRFNDPEESLEALGSVEMFNGELFDLARYKIKNGDFGFVEETVLKFIDYNEVEEELENEGWEEYKGYCFLITNKKD
jgi:uncharacterized protein YozE (UPF0346 family)